MNKVISAVLFIVMGLALFPIISGYADEATQEAEFITFVEDEDVTFSEDMTIKWDSDGSFHSVKLTSWFMEDDGGGFIILETDGSSIEDGFSGGGIIEVNINANTWIGTHEVTDVTGTVYYRDNTLTGQFAGTNLEGLINMLPLLSLISIIVGVTMLIQIKEDD